MPCPAVERARKASATEVASALRVLWKKHGVKVAFVQRENEMQFTIASYLTHAESVLGMDKPAAQAKWKGYLSDPNIENEGTELAPLLWIPTPKTRSKERTRYEDGSFEEGSKEMKNLSSADVQALKTFALSSANSHASSFLRQKQDVDSSAPGPAAPDLE